MTDERLRAQLARSGSGVVRSCSKDLPIRQRTLLPRAPGQIRENWLSELGQKKGSNLRSSVSPAPVSHHDLFCGILPPSTAESPGSHGRPCLTKLVIRMGKRVLVMRVYTFPLSLARSFHSGVSSDAAGLLQRELRMLHILTSYHTSRDDAVDLSSRSTACSGCVSVAGPKAVRGLL